MQQPPEPPYYPPQEPFQPPYQQPTQAYNTQPYPQPGQYAPGSLPPAPRPSKRKIGCIVAASIGGGLIFLLTICIIIGSFLPPSPTPQAQATATPTKAPTQNAKIQATMPSTSAITPTPTPIASVPTPTLTSSAVAIVPTSTPTSIPPTPTLAPTPTPVPPQAVLGGSIGGFTAKLGKPLAWNEYTTVYQPYQGLTSTEYSFAVSISRDVSGKDSVYKVTYRPAKPVKWDDGIRTCLSFLPTDALKKEAADYNTSEEQVFMSQTIARQFSPEAFRQGGKPTAPLITPGTIQVYSFYDAPLFGEKVLKSCIVQLGRVN